ncbi:unnamed protein product [Acanthocheilonema viteae]|uniref:Protein RER1 n=1 Tax=Acanthocheilonema viteae TaxID=6277 RepID=A0A498SF08_ACAVI|nr:unnamed protein product [Acanthocheilonema viteae]
MDGTKKGIISRFADLMEDSSDLRDRPSIVSRFFSSLAVKYQYYLDKLTPYSSIRWGIAIAFIILFLWRIVELQGFYIVTYALGIYYLNLFLAFLTPKIDPALDFESEDEDGPVLPSKGSEEFRPFMRRLPEFKFWYSAIKATVIAFICTFFQIFNVPVFWPILVMYFIVLTCLTMKRQIMHMIKYRYIPFTTGKPRMHGKEDSGVVVQG